ncbi:amidohydrolase [Paramagnetospirillum caucaseum]|uniref:Amidohydrolase n=1 Tax=Paramagnetospirillum caucaseum TaxID=1244869 RepID=M2ZQP0_9PROT|nr:amidohydrolase family protein [Paramagnetospirillum caucaseum]EME69627.1 amidohydrolase [Paramagnetospirillum caucaseum]
MKRLVVGSYFDGERHHADGPYAILHESGAILGVERVEGGVDARDGAAFAMPSLVDAHVHIFLDGAELDPARRKQAMAAGEAESLAVARTNAEASWRAGLGLIRDAGDPRGINHAARRELAAAGHPIRLRSPGPALHRPGRYGSFLGAAIAEDSDAARVVSELCLDADDIKVLLTGVIDFASGTVKGKPQFDEAAATAIVAAARRHGRPTFAHCNGPEGLAVAIRAGFDSIEHGYLMDEESLRAMAGEGIAWTPTLAPVAAQRHLAPDVSGFGPDILACLDTILARHAESILRAAQLGVALYCGSDAGGQGVPHGGGLVDEMLLLAGAGVPMETLLAGATALPRARWGEPASLIRAGEAFDPVVMPHSPFLQPQALRQARRPHSGDR